MTIDDTIGKSITNIYALVTMDVDGLDLGECFIELDNKIIIDIPFDPDMDVVTKTLDKNVVSLFSDLSDYPVYRINRKNRTIGDIVASYQRQSTNIFNRLKKVLFGTEVVIKEYQPYSIVYRENKIAHLKDRKIVDFLWYEDSTEIGVFLLDNGYLMTTVNVAPHGTGLAGLNYYENLTKLTEEKGNDYSSFMKKKQAMDHNRPV